MIKNCPCGIKWQTETSELCPVCSQKLILEKGQRVGATPAPEFIGGLTKTEYHRLYAHLPHTKERKKLWMRQYRKKLLTAHLE